VRKENNSIKRYVHLGTGNYNDQTAKIYTDMSIITCDESIGSDASKFFNIVTGFTKEINTSSLIIAPFSLRKKIKNLIHNEINISKAGGKGKIIAKMNSLVDKEIIDLLYTASNSGVEITLIIRGICSLASGIAELSKNIRVISVVGEFLEHSRIFYFENGGNTTVYLSSADWMTRNLDRRIELMFPVNDEKIKTRILSILNLYTMDNTNSWIQMQDGTYYKKQAEDSKESICSVHKKLKEFNYEGL
jgi:polyphosphate kinase